MKQYVDQEHIIAFDIKEEQIPQVFKGFTNEPKKPVKLTKYDKCNSVTIRKEFFQRIIPILKRIDYEYMTFDVAKDDYPIRITCYKSTDEPIVTFYISPFVK